MDDKADEFVETMIEQNRRVCAWFMTVLSVLIENNLVTVDEFNKKLARCKAEVDQRSAARRDKSD